MRDTDSDSGSTWESFVVIQQQTAHRADNDSAYSEDINTRLLESQELPRPPNNTPLHPQLQTQERPEFECYPSELKSFLSNAEMSGMLEDGPNATYSPESETEPGHSQPAKPVSASPNTDRTEEAGPDRTTNTGTVNITELLNTSALVSLAENSPPVEVTGLLKRITTEERKKPRAADLFSRVTCRARSHSVATSDLRDVTMTSIAEQDNYGVKRGRGTAEFSTTDSNDLNRALLNTNSSPPGSPIPMNSSAASSAPQWVPDSESTRTNTTSSILQISASPDLRQGRERVRRGRKEKKRPRI